MEKKRETKTKEKNSIESPIVRYDPRLDQYDDQVSQKTEEVNEKLENNPVFRESLIEIMKKYS